ncbi:MAG TPA: hypothetical protein VJ824_16450 [Bacillota bacterium]|nr:hypothetical protein [Bacillota bacterium]
MQTLYTFLYVLITIVILSGIFVSFRYNAKQKTVDHGISPNVKRNPIFLNPVYWAYLLFAAIFFGLVWVFKIYHRVPF